MPRRTERQQNSHNLIRTFLEFCAIRTKHLVTRGRRKLRQTNRRNARTADEPLNLDVNFSSADETAEDVVMDLDDSYLGPLATPLESSSSSNTTVNESSTENSQLESSGSSSGDDSRISRNHGHSEMISAIGEPVWGQQRGLRSRMHSEVDRQDVTYSTCL